MQLVGAVVRPLGRNALERRRKPVPQGLYEDVTHEWVDHLRGRRMRPSFRGDRTAAGGVHVFERCPEHPAPRRDLVGERGQHPIRVEPAPSPADPIENVVLLVLNEPLDRPERNIERARDRGVARVAQRLVARLVSRGWDDSR